MFIAAIFLTIRIYTKIFLARRFGLDDAALLLSKTLSVVVQALIVYYKMQKIDGAHVWDLSVPNFKTITRITAICAILYIWTTALAKVSILMLYLRLSPEKWFKFSIYTTMAFVTSFTIATSLALVFACVPLARVWDPTVTDGHCLNPGKVYLSMAGMNAATDVIMLILPMPLLNSLNLAFRQKMGIMLIFGVGSLTMITSLVRLALMIPLLKDVDVSWAIVTPGTWVCIEANLIIVCACLPTMRLFLRHFYPRLIGENNGCVIPAETPAFHQRESGPSVLSCMDRFTQRKYGIGRAGEITQTGSLIGRDRQSHAHEVMRIKRVDIDSIHSSTGATNRHSSAKEQNMTVRKEVLDGDETEVISHSLTAPVERFQEERPLQVETGHNKPDEMAWTDS
ncbi:hypothetical protein CBER1_00166 [Cercospora berteroae]|uniref:Rhodopsin domain-containing protein n=1 Tax=Cercospora berteroae TaxID=357750 RepID=A0A2S6CD85_9PEZI|nr:hypothetical protein CBER1_00166 [Cercospora berteroae]